MTPSEFNHWLAFILLGIPFAAIAGPHAWAAAWILAGLALATLHLIALAVAALWVLRKPFRFLVDGIALGLAGRLTGIFDAPVRAKRMRERFVQRQARQHAPRQPRALHRRSGRYFPWQSEGPNDDIPFGE